MNRADESARAYRSVSSTSSRIWTTARSRSDRELTSLKGGSAEFIEPTPAHAVALPVLRHRETPLVETDGARCGACEGARVKKIGRSDIIGQRGMAHLEGVVLSMGFLSYPTGGVEAGIDGCIELRDEETGAVGNLLLQVQGKSTKRQR